MDAWYLTGSEEGGQCLASVTDLIVRWRRFQIHLQGSGLADCRLVSTSSQRKQTSSQCDLERVWSSSEPVAQLPLVETIENCISLLPQNSPCYSHKKQHGRDMLAEGRNQRVLKAVEHANTTSMRLAIIGDNHTRHPLYIKRQLKPVPYIPTDTRRTTTTETPEPREKWRHNRTFQ